MNNISIINKESRKQIINGNIVKNEAAGLYVNNDKGDLIFKNKNNIYYQKIHDLDKLKKILNPPNRKSLLDTLVELGGEYHKHKIRNNRTFKKKQKKKRRKKRIKQQTIKKKKKEKRK
jgi:hypothetical protein